MERKPASDALIAYSLYHLILFSDKMGQRKLIRLNYGSGEKVSLKDFLRHVEEAISPQDAVTPTAQSSPEPGFGVILAVISLLVVMTMGRKK